MIAQLATAVVGISLAAQPVSFKEALERAERQSPELGALRLAIPEAEAGVEAAGALPNPVFSVSVGPDEPTVYGAVEQKLPFLGQRSSAMDAAAAQVPVARAELSQRALQLRAEVRRAYYGLAAAQAQVQLAEETARLTRELAQMASKKFEVGSAPQLDVEQAALASKRAEQDLADRRSALTVAQLHLATVLGDSPEPLLEASDELVPLPQPEPLAQLLSRAEHHPEVELAERQREAALARAQREKASIRPTPSLSLEVEHLGTAPGVGVRGGLAFDAAILSQAGGAVRVERLAADRAAARRQAALARLKGAAREAFAKWEAASRRVRFSRDELVPSAQNVARLARVGWELGRTPLANVVLAESEVASARSRAIDAAGEAWSALADLEEAAGAIR